MGRCVFGPIGVGPLTIPTGAGAQLVQVLGRVQVGHITGLVRDPCHHPCALGLAPIFAAKIGRLPQNFVHSGAAQQHGVAGLALNFGVKRLYAARALAKGIDQRFHVRGSQQRLIGQGHQHPRVLRPHLL